ncbi:hypothetical protein HNP94_000972 [Methanococcus maripaludis]|nr:hypothetical protein [Methanococcus maripaludis]MBA2863972.1 hypothetical protein [Methanococcus maripaludis]MBB6496031.1 hypothetical protein [Methanococcus maripaludis]
MYEFCIYSGEADSILKNSKIFDNNDDDPLYYILKFIYNNFIVINPLVAGNDFISGVLEYVGGLDVIKIMELKKAIEEKENPRGRLKFENQTINLLLHGGTYVDIGYDK